MKEIQLSRMIDMGNPQSVLDEVGAIVLMINPQFDFETVDSIFKDIVLLFRGEYPGYCKCSTEYHDLKHTTDTFFTMARLMHGVFLGGENFNAEQVNLGLICALMHNTGFIQTLDNDVGTGAKYTLTHIRRSIAFMDKYIADNGLSKEDFANYSYILNCTGLHAKINETQFESWDIELLCKMLGTADLLGQMADRTYLEKLLFLFYEFKEGGVTGYDNELELLRKTLDFYDMIRKRLTSELGSVNKYMRYHFKALWKVDRDLYMDAIENHINYLRFLLKNHEKDYREHLRRGGIVKKLSQKVI